MELEAGKSYLWCSCGKSQTQPFCDGSHKGSGLMPMRYVAKFAGEEVLFCGCKQSKNKPFCDGTHNSLITRYADDDPLSTSNRLIPQIAAEADGKARLDGNCLVCDMRSTAPLLTTDFSCVEIVGSADGAVHQSLFLVEIGSVESPSMTFGECEVVLTVVSGGGTIVISGLPFEINKDTGIYIRPNEVFSFQCETAESLRCFTSVSPLFTGAPAFVPMRNNFDERHPERIARIDPAQRQVMAERFFQMMVDGRHGSEIITQFIGEIPLSKAAPHRHLYEEVLMVMRGSGMMWTENVKTIVNTGDIIFLPRKQLHSLESTDPEGMLVAGVICPGNNPSINY
ncbi:CDGSH iron-sulfur domain-containing protein [Glaciimonas sp. PAMC28666]|uniref:CDGSH iron-sulfur domain-containing protein n=1 Tax=Glaciimonas sp. PAMC28666 TaxID=2807626 RepID=UPI001F045B05|nr:CDGSH iron-sulfur domain-containing protein [Glaciimonas sp. PAMC28666]